MVASHARRPLRRADRAGRDVDAARRRTGRRCRHVGARRVAPRSRAIVSKHRLQVEGRAADDLEHVARRRLLLERFGQLAGARLHLLEQPHVLDGDHRLVGEGLHQLDLLVAERPAPRRGQCTSTPIGLALAHQRNGEDRARSRRLPRLCPSIRTPDPAARRERGSSRRSSAARPCTMSRPSGSSDRSSMRDRVRRHAALGRELQSSPSRRKIARVIGLAEPRGDFDERLAGPAADRTAERLMTLQDVAPSPSAARSASVSSRCAPAPPRTAARSRWR